MNWVSVIITIAGFAVWSWFMVGYGELIDRWKRIDDAHQEALSKPVYLWMRFMVWFGSFAPPIPLWGFGTIVILYLGLTHPEEATQAASLAGLVWGGVYALRAPEDNDEPTDIQQLRAALGDINKDPDNPPTVTLEQPVDGPQRAIIGGHPNFKEYQKAHRDAMEQAIEYRLHGDWENISWYDSDGSSIWERVIHPPDRVDYLEHQERPYYELSCGPDGFGKEGVVDLRVSAHVMVAGNTRGGKTALLRGWLAHGLSQGVEVVGIDVKSGLSFLRGRAGVRAVATRRIDRMAEVMAAVRREVDQRDAQFERDGSYRGPLFVACDEVATACLWAEKWTPPRGMAKDDPVAVNVKDFTSNLLEVARLGGQYKVHLLLATQRPDADAIPIEIRGQCEWRITVGSVEPTVARMMYETRWAMAAKMPKVKGRLVLGDFTGQDNAWHQPRWFADPRDTDQDEDERILAEALLPPVVDVQIADDHDGIPDESGASVQVETKSKREPSAGSHGDGTPFGVGTNAVTTERGLLAMLERAQRDKAANAERTRKWRAGFLEALRDPNSPKHGTRTAIKEGCPLECDKCTPKPAEVAS